MTDKKPTPRTNKSIKQCKESDSQNPHTDDSENSIAATAARPSGQPLKEKEYGGYESQGLPEPTRFGDWEVKGRCSDF